MARILLGWEAGGGFGHVACLLPVARALLARGHEVVLALRDPVGTWPMLRGAGLTVLPAPYLGDRPQFNGGRPFHARSYVDILAFQGFDDMDAVEPVARAWRELVEMVQPQLVIAEHAPTLCVACHGRVPVINVGTGFTVPFLRAGVFLPLNPAVPETVPVAQVEAIIRQLLDRPGQPLRVHPLQAVLGDESLVLTYNLIDPYRSVRATRAVGPLWVPPPPLSLPASPSCFVYLPGEHPAIRALAAGLLSASIPGTLFVPNASPQLLDLLRATPLKVVTQPVDLDEVLPATSVVLHHGGAGITQRCLAWGRPQLVAPIWLEQALTADTLVRVGVAQRLSPPGLSEQVGLLLGRIAQDSAMAGAAQRVADILRGRFPGNAIDQVMARCRARLLAS